MTYTMRVVQTDETLAALTESQLQFEGSRAALVLAFIAPHLDFHPVVMRLKQRCGDIRLVAVTTAGELFSEEAGDPLYVPATARTDGIILYIMPPDMLAGMQVASIPLHNDDIRCGSFTLEPQKRINLITHELETLQLQLDINVRDTVALVWVDGLSSCENYLMEAVYNSGRFPCMFVGGSSGSKADMRHS